MRSRVGRFFSSALLCALAVTAVDPAIAAAPVPSTRYALAAPDARYRVETAGVDRGRELAADVDRPKSLPLRYAAERPLANVFFRSARAQGGEWRDLADGMALWRIPLLAPNALTLDFGFRRFFLPPGAQLFIHNATQTLGPYTDADNPRSREFWTPLIVGDSAQIEVLLPQAMKPFLELELSMLHAGYRDLFATKSLANPNTGSGACNIDTICSQGDIWRREVNAEAVLVANATFCSGQLINNTRGDHAPLLLTASHCYASQTAGNELVVYWKYESPTCRAVGSAANAQPVPTTNALAQTGGATLLAANADSDVTLFQLAAAPPAAANAYFNGWDNTEIAFSGGVVIHHPNADAKRISFAAGTIVTNDDTSIGEGIHHWRVDHYSQGTTEAGSSGSGLLDGSHRLRGVLSNGAADCSDPAGEDYYGRISTAWQGGGTPDTRLSDWLDPGATGASQLDGAASCTPPTVSLAISANPIVAGDKVILSASVSGGSAPYHYAFDVDGDGIADSTDPSQSSIPAVYPGAYSGNVSVSVTDSSGCTGVASRALVVQAPQIEQTPAPLSAPTLLCGSASTSLNPGQRWRTPVALINNGNAASQAGYAIFAQNPTTLGQTRLTLETPAVPVPALAPGQIAVLNLDYAIDAASACGAPVRIDYLGAADGRGFNASAATIVDAAIDANCQAISTCPAVTTALPLDAGSYYDPLRAGNGITLANVPQGTNDPVFFGLWFSGDSARQPIWYQVQAALHANQVNSPLYMTRQTSPPTWPVRPASIGAAQITLVEPDKFVFTWNFSGNAGGSLFVPVTSYPSTIRIWYSPAESGWGLYDQLAQLNGASAAPLLASLAYIYDSAGTPRWIEATNPGYVDGATLAATSLRPACPACVWLDYRAGQQTAGSLTYTGSGSNMQISTNLFFPNAIPGNWTRSQLPLTLLYLAQ